MAGRPKKTHREKDLTQRFLGGAWDEDQVDARQRFSDRSKHAQQDKMLRTVLARAEEPLLTDDIDALPLGEVVQVHSLFCEVLHEGQAYLCVVRRTLAKAGDIYVVVGDRVRFRPTDTVNETALPEAVIEQILERRTVLTRTDSFKGQRQQIIVSNAEQLLLVASLVQPRIKWGLVDRMLVAAQAGGLSPMLCLNKIDLADEDKTARSEWTFAQEALAHYQSLGIRTLQASATRQLHVEELRQWLTGQTTVLAGHSGVGKSSLINAIEPRLNLKTNPVSNYNDKGRHTTTSARRYPLPHGGTVIDTPGVKLFGLWGITRDNLLDYFPDIAEDTAPEWRRESFQRILESLTE